ALCITHTPQSLISDRLAPFALHPALPGSLVGRESHDYYGAYVAIELALLRRSHVRLCRTSERDLGALFVSFNILIGYRSRPWRLCRPACHAGTGLAPVSGVFPADGPLHLLETGVQAIQLYSPYRAGPSTHRSIRLDTAVDLLPCC